jgi:hypothetical protein
MISKKASDLSLGDEDLPTSEDDVRALRANRARWGHDWLEELTDLARQMPEAAEDLRRRRTFAGGEPFEL